jgi:hypothetical protein
MARGASGSALGHQFDEFLFASVRDESGGPLSVLSALARLDVDPWREAAALAGLSRQAAVDRLTSLFARLPDAAAPREAGAAARLVALLPSPAALRAATPGVGAPTTAPAKSWAAGFVILYVIAMLAVMGIEGVAASRQPSTQASAAVAPAPSHNPAVSEGGLTPAQP